MAEISLILPKTSRGELDHPFPPLGILYLSAALEKEGIETKVIDGNILEDKAYEKALENISSEYIGLSTTFFHMNEINRILPRLQNKKVPIIIGGPGVSSIRDKEGFLKETGIEYMLEGEAEESLPQLIRNIEREENFLSVQGIHTLQDDQLYSEGSSPKVNVNKNPIPNRAKINIKEYTENWGNYTGIIASRGCPYTCSFCDLSVAGHKVRYRNAENVVKEMNELHDLGLEDVFIFDDLFTVNKKYLSAFRDERIRKGKAISWGGNARVNLVNNDFCEIVEKSGGNRLFFGVESGSERILDLYGKNIKPEQTMQAFATCWNKGIEPKAYILVGHPEETWEDIEKTADLVAKIKPAYVDISILTPIPNTKLFDETSHLIDFSKFKNMDTRQKNSVYNLNFDIHKAIKLIDDAYQANKK